MILAYRQQHKEIPVGTQQLPADLPEVQGAIYRLALTLDAFLVNGIQYGVLQRVAGNGILQKTAQSLWSDLTSLEEHALWAPVGTQAKVADLLASLRAACQKVVDVVSGLSSFRALPLEQVRSTVAQVPRLRGECVSVIQALEGLLQTPKPFYTSRPAHSTAAVDEFLASLERLFAEAWNAAK